eukprot:GHVQ01037157.1.p1 GENE.GHVQ01037157.1~~GHVQ01037157.1.p1  ORF type:complete len:268 (-),score=27.01 GHVQ01037157.1:553-1356(-)
MVLKDHTKDKHSSRWKHCGRGGGGRGVQGTSDNVPADSKHQGSSGEHCRRYAANHRGRNHEPTLPSNFFRYEEANDDELYGTGDPTGTWRGKSGLKQPAPATYLTGRGGATASGTFASGMPGASSTSVLETLRNRGVAGERDSSDGIVVESDNFVYRNWDVKLSPGETIDLLDKSNQGGNMLSEDIWGSRNRMWWKHGDDVRGPLNAMTSAVEPPDLLYTAARYVSLERTRVDEHPSNETGDSWSSALDQVHLGVVMDLPIHVSLRP